MKKGPGGAASSPSIKRGQLVLVFAVQVVVGTALFMLIAGAAVIVNVCLHWLEARHLADGLIGTILQSVEVLILCVDAGLFVLYILMEAIIFIREMWRAAKGSHERQEP